MNTRFLTIALLIPAVSASGADSPLAVKVKTPATLFPLTDVRLLPGPFTDAVKANRVYMLALDPDRLLAPFLREAGLKPKKESYPNWESSGLDGHTAGHYLSALADMIAAGDDTKDGELKRRLDYMVKELADCQKAYGDGYIGGVPGSKALWAQVETGNTGALGRKWVPWYNIHKTYAGLRDAYLVGGNAQAKDLLVKFGDWAGKVTAKLSDDVMQRMLGTEHGGMNEVLADIYAITGDQKYLDLAKRFSHRSILGPLEQKQDKLTGLHANTQIPKIIGFERIATLSGDKQEDAAARFFWETVTRKRSVAFGGNSVSEHFNDPKDFHGMLEHREGPETCNTYNMLRLTEQLFTTGPDAGYADYYERALYNHILSAINPETPGYVYFTPIRPGHYRVYSQPDDCFWCCVGTGMENPGRYGQFIYAKDGSGLYVNLFMASELSMPEAGLVLRQDTKFPDEEGSQLTLKLEKPSTFTLNIRHPAWVSGKEFGVKVNGEPVPVSLALSSYSAIRREWKNGDKVEIKLPMRTSLEQLPDGSEWYAIMRGPIVLASPDGTENLAGLRADDARMGHVAHGPLEPMDKAPVLISSSADLPGHIKSDGKPMQFRITDVALPEAKEGLPLKPFFRIHDSRYQMYWNLATKEGLAARQERLAMGERAKLARDAATLDSVAVGEQQPEVDHSFSGEDTKSGQLQNRRWRDGKSFQYTLDTRGEKAVELFVTYWGGDRGRVFDILVNDTPLTTKELTGTNPPAFVEEHYAIPAGTLTAAPGGRLTVKFVAKQGRAGGIFDIRLMRPASPASTNH